MKIEIDYKEFDKIKQSVSKDVFDKAFITTSNELFNGSFSKARTQIKRKWNIDIKQENKEWAFANKSTGKTNKRNGRMKLTRANVNNKYITLDIVGTPLNLSLFEYTWTQEIESKKTFKSAMKVIKKKHKIDKISQNKVRVKILKSEATILQTAFVATMKNGHRGIFQRAESKRLPILEKRTITPQSMFKQIDFENILQKDFDDRLMNRFAHNLNRLTNGYWK